MIKLLLLYLFIFISKAQIQFQINNSQLTISGNGYIQDFEDETLWNSYKEIVTSIVIHDSITSIGNKAFFDFNHLETITLGKDITRIGKAAFYNTKIKSIHVPLSVKVIEESAFQNCKYLEQITFEDNSQLERIERKSFVQCQKLKSIIFPSSLQIIEKECFDGCENLQSISIGSELKSIGDNCFVGCYQLSSLIVDERNTMFSSNNNILFSKDTKTLLFYPQGLKTKHFDIPEGVEKIERKAFKNSKLSSITFPSTLTEIGESAFYMNNYLEMITIPSSITLLDIMAFGCCKSLHTIFIHSEKIIMKQFVFAGCDKLKSVYILTQSISENFVCSSNVFDYSNQLNHISTLSKTNLGTINMICGKTIQKHLLKDSEEESSNNHWMIDSTTNVLYLWGKQSLKQLTLLINEVDWKTKITTVVVEHGFTTIESSVFSGFMNVEKIQLPSSIVSLRDNVFNECSS